LSIILISNGRIDRLKLNLSNRDCRFSFISDLLFATRAFGGAQTISS
jgi:hypothetical protein